MTEDQFNDAYQELCDAYGFRPKIEQSRAWYRRVRGFPADRLEKAVEKVIGEEPRFPSLARLLAACATIGTEGRGTSRSREKCVVCDGYGFVRIGLEIYAGACVHGARLPKFKVAPIDEQGIFALLREQEKHYDRLYGAGHWQSATRDLRNFAGRNCLPPATWL